MSNDLALVNGLSPSAVAHLWPIRVACCLSLNLASLTRAPSGSAAMRMNVALLARMYKLRAITAECRLGDCDYTPFGNEREGTATTDDRH
jgi:hypothetical protein